jgi:hypothetical protein
MSASTEPCVRPRPHPRLPLSKETERRLLRDLLDRAERGDIACAEALIRLANERRRTTPSAAE